MRELLYCISRLSLANIENKRLILTDGVFTIPYTFKSHGKLDVTYEYPDVFSRHLFEKD